MAGLGFKDFAVGEVLTSADVDGYLMQQTVMRFADDAARGSALGTAAGTAVPLAEGMISYLDDVNRIEVYDGAAWQQTTSVLQVASTTKTNVFSTTSTSFVDITGLSVTITPRFSTSKILVMGFVTSRATLANQGGFFNLVRDSTAIAIGDAAGSRTRATGVWQGGAAGVTGAVTMLHLDSPATTSSVTYKVQMRSSDGNTAVVGSSTDDANLSTRARTACSITVLEVAG